MADYSFIAGNGLQQTPYDPLKMVTNLQSLQNMQTENQLNQQQLGIRQSNLADSQRLQMAQQFSALASPSLVPDEQVVGVGRKMLNVAVANNLNPALAQRYSELLDAGDIGQIRQMANLGMIGMLHGPEAINAIVGQKENIDTGHEIQPGMVGGPFSANPFQFKQTSPSITKESSPESREVFDRVYDPARGWVYKQHQQIPTGPGATGQNSGGAPTGGGSSTGSTGGGDSTGTNGATTNGATSTAQNVPNLAEPNIGVKADIEKQVAAYDDAQLQAPLHERNIQSLTKAHDALEMVGTGRGTPQALANLRAFAVGLMTNTGFQASPDVVLQNASADVLDKYLTDYARQATLNAGTNLDTALAGKSNASGTINPLAARSVINTNIGRERLELLAQKTLTNKNTFATDRAKLYAEHDPEGLAVDMIAPGELKQKLAHMSRNDQIKYDRSVEMANTNKLLSMGRQNQFRGGATQIPYPPSVSPQ